MTNSLQRTSKSHELAGQRGHPHTGRTLPAWLALTAGARTKWDVNSDGWVMMNFPLLSL